MVLKTSGWNFQFRLVQFLGAGHFSELLNYPWSSFRGEVNFKSVSFGKRLSASAAGTHPCSSALKQPSNQSCPAILKSRTR